MKKKISCLIMCAMSCAVVAQTTGQETGHTWIDLGLPSGVKWATANIGASLPQDEGSYYAWGETALKTDFRWATYTHVAGQNSLTKYSGSDGLLSLDATDDVASCAWGGKTLRCHFGIRRPSTMKCMRLLIWNDWLSRVLCLHRLTHVR